MFSIELVKRKHLATGGKQAKHHFFRKMCLKKVKDLYGDVKDVYGGPGYHSEKIIFEVAPPMFMLMLMPISIYTLVLNAKVFFGGYLYKFQVNFNTYFIHYIHVISEITLKQIA